jgi:hypothetical protein
MTVIVYIAGGVVLDVEIRSVTVLELLAARITLEGTSMIVIPGLGIIW